MGVLMPPNLRRIAPGVYDDADGGMHLVLGEMLTANGYPDTPENRQQLIDAVAEAFPGIPVESDG
jgi:hypothetical protein